MNQELAERLCALNTQFYADNAASFSATRQQGWAGWERFLRMVGLPELLRTDTLAAPDDRLVVLDIAAGNMRFEHFLAESFPGTSLEAHAVDNCVSLAERALGKCERPCTYVFHERDLAGGLARGESVLEGIPLGHITVSWGFMHHVPTMDARARFVRELVNGTRPGGIVGLSFWRFADEPRMLEKAERATAAGCEELGLAAGSFDPGDYLLGWKDAAHAYRYCHSFTDAEIDCLLAEAGERVRIVDRYRADGKTGQSNEYLVLRV